MNKFVIGAAALLVGGVAVAGTAKKPDLKSVAEKLAGSVSVVKEGEIVAVTGDVRDIDFLQEIGLAAAKRGGYVLTSVGKESYGRRWLDEVPAKYDGREPKLGLELTKLADVEFSVQGEELPGQFKDAPAERVIARMNAGQKVEKARLENGQRSVFIGNGLYPTEATAKQYGLTKDQLATLFWSGLDVDYAKLQADTEAVRAALASGKQMHVTHPNGTDLTVSIEARPVFTSDGVISEDDVKKGGAGLQVWLPAGEAYVTPVAGTAEGKVVFDRIPFNDSAIEGLTVTFKAGKMVAHTAKPSKAYDRFKELHASATGPKDELSVVDIGTNRAVKVPAGSKLTSFIPAGSFTLGWGNNVWAGGTNDASGGFISSMNGATVTVDGKAIVEKGELKLAGTGS